ncbi:MAG: peptidylprolyl isomerase [Candidatus Zixiibacteriota bacterium]
MAKFKILLTTIIMAAVLTSSGCRAPMVGHEDIIKKDFSIVQIDSVKNINASDLYLRLALSELVPNGGILDSTTYFDTLQSIVLDSMISLEAKNVNLKDDESLYRIYDFRFRDYYVDKISQILFRDPIVIDSSQIDSFVNAHKEAYTYEEQVHARHIVISPEGYRLGADSALYKDYSDEKLEELCKMKITEIKTKIDSGVDFGLLAFENSMHRESGDKDGELGYFPRNKYRQEFTDVAFNTQPGTVSEPFRTPDGWHIVEVLDHVDSGMAELTPEIYADAEMNCREHFANRRAAQFLDSLFQASNLVFNDSAMAMGVMNVPETTWAMIINGLDTLTFHRIGDYLHQYKMGADITELTTLDIKQSFAYRAVKYLMAQAGNTLGLDKYPEIAQEREKLYHKYCINMIRKGQEVLDYTPPDSLIEDYYRQHIDDYVFKQPIYVQQIISDDSLFAEFLRDQALSGVDFLELAEQYYPGAEEIRVAASDLGWIGPDEMPKEFYEKAKVTAINQISYPVKTDLGYHIIKVLDKRYSRSLDQVQSSIVHQLKKQYKEDFAKQWNKSVFARHNLQYNLEPIKKIKLAEKDRR